jgi:pimeloyl-ACP methyl ester carboxylesterase
MPSGFSTRDMADDYADFIKMECDGHVDLIVGISYGGIIAQHFAAEYAELVDHLVICSAAYKGSVDGKALDYRYAELLNQNKPRTALALMAGALTGNKAAEAVMRPFLWLVAPRIYGESNNEVFRRDVLVEAEAELEHNGRESLVRIPKPTLVLGGAHDHYFPESYLQETADLIPQGELIIYPDKGHDVLGDGQAARDILAWVANRER